MLGVIQKRGCDMSVEEIEFFEVHRLFRHKNSFLAYCWLDGGEHYSVRVPRGLREILYAGCYIGVDSLSNIRCVCDDSGRIVFLDGGCKITYKKKLITPLTRNIIF